MPSEGALDAELDSLLEIDFPPGGAMVLPSCETILPPEITTLAPSCPIRLAPSCPIRLAPSCPIRLTPSWPIRLPPSFESRLLGPVSPAPPEALRAPPSQ